MTVIEIKRTATAGGPQLDARRPELPAANLVFSGSHGENIGDNGLRARPVSDARA